MTRRAISDPAVNGEVHPTGSPPEVTPYPPAPPAGGTAPDPFDLNRLRLAPDDDAALGVRELLVSLPYRKPSKESFFRVRTGDEWRCTGGLIELKDDDTDNYWVTPDLWPYLADEPTFGRRLVVLAVTRQGAPFLWGLRLPGPDGKSPPWVEIPLEAAKAAETRWAKLYWDQLQKRHRVKVSVHLDEEPVWPTQSLSELLRLAFKDRVIATPDHPVLQRLRGEK
jgi:hypothetical protein